MYKESHIRVCNIFPVLMTLCVVGLSNLELFYMSLYMSVVKVFVCWELMGDVRTSNRVWAMSYSSFIFNHPEGLTWFAAQNMITMSTGSWWRLIPLTIRYAQGKRKVMTSSVLWRNKVMIPSLIFIGPLRTRSRYSLSVSRRQGCILNCNLHATADIVIVFKAWCHTRQNYIYP